ncbi:MAG: hypothetical protein K2U26_03300 [Cyclobacteriaceae bacterium]|nr:hypothetical protein [Cyclobacteriaceae bacterium]
MKVINVHSRIVQQPKAELAALFKTLASRDDKMLATDKWPAMKLDAGLSVGSKGGHGPIRYFVTDYRPGEFIRFQFTKPNGFDGGHEFEIIERGPRETEIKHTITMNISGVALVTWPLAIRWLHDALIEDAFDKVENHFTQVKKASAWNMWVKILRAVMRSRSKRSRSIQ